MATRRRELVAGAFEAPALATITEGDNPLAEALRAGAGLANQVVETGKRQIRADATEAGQLAGLDEGFKKREGGGLFNRVFNDAASQIYLTQGSRRTRIKMQELEVEHSADPEAFNAAVRGYTEGILAEADQDLAPFLQADMENQSAGAAVRVGQRFEANIQADRESSIRGELGEVMKEIGQAANAGDLERAAFLADKYNGLISMAQTGARPLFTPPQEAAMRREVSGEVDRETVIGAFGREASVEAKEDFIRIFNENNVDFDPTTKRQLSAWMANEVRRQRADAQADIQAAKSERKALRDSAAGDVGAVIGRLESGLPVSSEELNATHRSLNDQGFTDLDLELHRSQRWAVTYPAFARSTIEEMDQGIAAQRPGDEVGLARVQRLRAIRESQAKMRAEDPMQAAIGTGLVAPVDFDPSDPATWSGVMDNVGRIESAWGLRDVSPLTDRQSTELSNWFRQQDAAGQFGALTAIYDGVGPSSTRGVIEQLDKNQLPLLAGALEVYSESALTPAAATDALMILEGPFRKQQAAPAMETAPTMLQNFSDFIGGVFESSGGNFDSAFAAAMAHYQTNVVMQGWNAYDPENFKRSIRAVVGEPVAWSNEGWGGPEDSLILPPRGWSEPDVEQWVDNLSPAQLIDAGGAFGFEGEALDTLLDQIRSQARFITVDRGRVMIELPGPMGRAGLLRIAGDLGQPLILDMGTELPVDPLDEKTRASRAKARAKPVPDRFRAL